MGMYAQVQGGSPMARDAGRRGSDASQSTDAPQSSQPQQKDSVSLSPTGKELSQKRTEVSANDEKGVDRKPLPEEDLATLTKLKTRDTEVRSHEQAHLAAAGQYAAGGASFSYTTGPNGKRYATGGEVPIDISKEDTPAATIAKMRTVRRAALAPANPSAADRSIASQASSKEAQARRELQEEASVTAGTPTDKVSADSDTTTKSPDKSTNSQPQTPQISDYSRKIMNSAYQTMAALAA